jgi:hypothetical protein
MVVEMWEVVVEKSLKPRRKKEPATESEVKSPPQEQPTRRSPRPVEVLGALSHVTWQL